MCSKHSHIDACAKFINNIKIFYGVVCAYAALTSNNCSHSCAKFAIKYSFFFISINSAVFFNRVFMHVYVNKTWADNLLVCIYDDVSFCFFIWTWLYNLRDFSSFNEQIYIRVYFIFWVYQETIFDERFNDEYLFCRNFVIITSKFIRN